MEENTKREVVEYPCDDNEEPLSYLHILRGNDGDYHISIKTVKIERDKNVDYSYNEYSPSVRLCLGGGASSKAPGLTTGICKAFEAIAKYMDENDK